MSMVVENEQYCQGNKFAVSSYMAWLVCVWKDCTKYNLWPILTILEINLCRNRFREKIFLC